MLKNTVIVFSKNFVAISFVLYAQLFLNQTDLSQFLLITTVVSLIMSIGSFNLMFAAQAYLTNELETFQKTTIQQIFTFRVLIIVVVLIYVSLTGKSLWILSLYVSRTLLEHLFATFRVLGKFDEQAKLSLYYLFLTALSIPILTFSFEEVTADILIINIIIIETLVVLTAIISHPQARAFLTTKMFSYSIMIILLKKAFSTYPNSLFLPILNGYFVISFFDVLPNDSFISLSLAAKYSILALPVFAIISNSSVQGFQKVTPQRKKTYLYNEIVKIVILLTAIIISFIICDRFLDLSRFNINILLTAQMFILFFSVAFYSFLMQYLVYIIKNSKRVFLMTIIHLTLLFVCCHAAELVYLEIGLNHIITTFTCLMIMFSMQTFFIIRSRL